MPATDSIPLSSEVARSGTPPPPPTVDVDNDADNNNQGDEHGQGDASYIETTTSTATQQDDYQYQEQNQSRLDSEAGDDRVGEEDDYEDEGDTDWGDDDEDDYFGEEPDPVYVADLLRQSGIDWMQYPNYATHRLVVTSSAEATGAEGQVPGRQYYRIMAQFLVPGSAVFRDFLLGKDTNAATNDDEDEEENEEEKMFRKERLSCLQDGPFTDSDPSLADNTYFQDPTNAPDIARSLLEPLEPYIYQRYAPYTPATSSDADTDPYAHQPWVHLSLLHPEHFPGPYKSCIPWTWTPGKRRVSVQRR